MKQRESMLYPTLERPGVVEIVLLTQLVVLFPLFQFLPPWVTAICLSCIGYRFYLKRFNKRLPGRVLTAVVGLLGGILIFLEFKTFQGRDAGVSLIVLMFSLKLMEMRWYRDAALVLFLSFFILVAHFLYSQSILMTIYMLAALAVILSALMALNRVDGARNLKSLGWASGKIILQALPIMLILFFLFPRLAQPLWQMPSGSTGTTGISDSMTPGDIGSLVTFTEPAFRVKFDGQPPPGAQRYWRGLVFSDFDGLTWSRNQDPFRPAFTSQSDIELKGAPVTYELLMEPHRRNWLYALEMPESMDGIGRMTTEYTWLRRFNLTNKLSYEVVSYPESSFGLVLDNRTRQINLDLPNDYNPVTRDWVANVRAQYPDDEAFIQMILRYINQQAYHYTLSPGTMAENTVDDFWFNKQRGFCEHYAGAFVFIMRAAGIPSRVVTGYQGGEMNPYGDYMIVRQSDAHAWTEVWLAGQGWRRIDPTAAIHPSRVEVDLSQDWLQREALFADQAPSEWSQFTPSMISQISLMWDSVNSYWQSEIIDFGAEDQYMLLQKLGFDYFSMSDLINLMLVIVGLIFITSTLWILRNRISVDPIARAYLKINHKLAQSNLQKHDDEGPLEHLARVKQSDAKLAAKLRPIVTMYIQLRYQNKGQQTVGDGPSQSSKLQEDFLHRANSFSI